MDANRPEYQHSAAEAGNIHDALEAWLDQLVDTRQHEGDDPDLSALIEETSALLARYAARLGIRPTTKKED